MVLTYLVFVCYVIWCDIVCCFVWFWVAEVVFIWLLVCVVQLMIVVDVLVHVDVFMFVLMIVVCM